MTLRVLLVESEPDDTLFLRDVLSELDGARCWKDWVRLETSYAATCAEALALLKTEVPDIVLLDPDLLDVQGAETFRRIQIAAPQAPVILLINPGSLPLAERLVRAGAQDFLLKKEVDCEPLARVIRNALERHRILAATRATSTTDPLTGFFTRPAFVSLANRDRLLAERLGRRLLILVAEPSVLKGGAQGRDLALLETADRIRELAGPAALLARLDLWRFGLALFDTEAESVENIWARLHMGAADGAIAFGAAVFDPHRPASLDALLEQATLDLHSAAAGV